MPKQNRDRNLISLGSMNPDGSHRIIHPHQVSGPFTRYRTLFAALCLFIYAALPWIPINGNPAVFLDIASRRFHIFGITLVTQDLWVLFFAISGLAFGLFLITSLLGRIWCGWACPYTLFLEQIYRRIEKLIDGDHHERRMMENAPWTGKKILKRAVKISLYLAVSALIAHIFISYFVSLPTLYTYIISDPREQLTTFLIVSGLTATFYFCFAHFREQFCILVCPYGRIQSALTDDDTMIIGYDEKRGEPRGKKHDPTAGDCIDCNRCVNVCPTGIDIRHGLQLECIGCAACIDACDLVMTKIGRPKGLIRYDSYNGLEGKKRTILRPRIYLYLGLAALGLIALAISVYFNARPITARATRMRGAPYYTDAQNIRNNYEIRLANKRNKQLTFTIDLLDARQPYTLSPSPSTTLTLQPSQETKQPLIISIQKSDYTGSQDLIIKITAQPGDTTITQKVRFLGPAPTKNPKIQIPKN